MTAAHHIMQAARETHARTESLSASITPHCPGHLLQD